MGQDWERGSPVSLTAALRVISQLLLKKVNECVWRIHRISWFFLAWKRGGSFPREQLERDPDLSICLRDEKPEG